ncbi:MAG: CapA family protein [Saprospiraceae bacterium]|nr:CapA family protein [Saprospiraceae bacterium]
MPNLTSYLSFFFLATFLIACGSDQERHAPSGNHTVDKDTVETPPKKTQHKIKLAFVGDIMGHGDQIRSAYDPRTKTYNYEPCFRYVKPILEEADLAIGNLEVTLSAKGKYTGYPRFRSPDALGTALKGAGFDFLVTANNHSNDNNLYGVIHTLDTIDAMGFIHTGTFRDSAERKKTYPLILEREVDGTVFKLAFLNYTYSTNGIPTQAPSVVNMIDEEVMLKDIETAKAANPDMIIAIMHWGSEYMLDERPRQQRRTKLLWENGVDVVIGAHPHVIEPIKTDTFYNADSSAFTEKLVAYSLGNFISNQFRKNTDIGLIFELELIKDSKANKTIIGAHDYVLAWRYIHNRSKAAVDRTHTAIPVTAFENDSTNFLGMSKSDLVSMQATAKRMRKHLGKWQSAERIVTFAELKAKGIIPLGK